jgi:WD40 repeat protein
MLWLAACCASQTTGEQTDALLFKFKSPDHRVRDVVLSPDGKLVAASYGFSDQGGVTIWNVLDHSIVTTLLTGTKEQAGVVRIAFSVDGKQFAAATSDGDVILWTVGNWRSPKTILEHRGSPRDLSFSRTKLGFASDDVALLYDLQTSQVKVLAEKASPGESYNGISFTPDGKVVAVCGRSETWLWDVAGEKRLVSWETKSSGFFGRLSPDGTYLIAGGGSVFGKKSVKIWNVNEKKQLSELTEFRGGVFSVAISNSSRLFAVAGGNYGGGSGDLSLWSIDDAREIGFTSFGKSPMHGLAFSQDDRLLAVGSEDGFVLLYDVDRLRGPVLTKQSSALCGEIVVKENRAFIRAMAKVPMPMRDFEYPWKLEISNAESVAGVAGAPVVLDNWTIESNSGTDRVRITAFRSLLQTQSLGSSDYILFGYVQNPGWDQGFVAKIYGDGSFVASDNSGKCKAYGSLDQLKTNFESVRNRLVNGGLLNIAKDPLTLGVDHYGTGFIELKISGVTELRTDADDIAVLLNGGAAKKRQAFTRIFKRERAFIDSLLSAGMKLPVK